MYNNIHNQSACITKPPITYTLMCLTQVFDEIFQLPHLTPTVWH